MHHAEQDYVMGGLKLTWMTYLEHLVEVSYDMIENESDTYGRSSGGISHVPKLKRADD